MKIEKCEKQSFTVIGREGSTRDGDGFVRKLWADANAHFGEVAPLARKDETGKLLGVWGVMSDFSRSFRPWENNFSEGLYLAGIECADDAQAPAGWTKWVVPGYEYLYAQNTGPDTFRNVLEDMKKHGVPLAGAVHDFSCPQTGKDYLFFPIRRL